jgi:hypothetical protein
MGAHAVVVGAGIGRLTSARVLDLVQRLLAVMAEQ